MLVSVSSLPGQNGTPLICFRTLNNVEHIQVLGNDPGQVGPELPYKDKALLADAPSFTALKASQRKLKESSQALGYATLHCLASGPASMSV